MRYSEVEQKGWEKGMGRSANCWYWLQAARGLDITDVDLVVHYELPQDPEAFLHRSGAPAAGEKGLLGGERSCWLCHWK